MRSVALGLAGLCCALAGTASAGDPYNITVYYSDNGKGVHMPAWYGDGNLYVGSTVPSDVQTVFNFTGTYSRPERRTAAHSSPSLSIAQPQTR
jgi:hypothetical protein